MVTVTHYADTFLMLRGWKAYFDGESICPYEHERAQELWWHGWNEALEQDNQTKEGVE